MMSEQQRKEAARWAQIEKDDPSFALLHYAEIGHLRKVKKLLALGVDPDVRHDLDTGIEAVTDTALYAAAGAGHMQVAEALLDAKANVDIEADDNWRPLHHAVLNGQEKMARLLVSRGADINRRENIVGQTPLHIAAERGNSRCVRALIELGADRNLRDFRGRRPDEVICEAFLGRDGETPRRKAAIAAIFNDAAREDAGRRRAAHAALSALQKDVPVAKPLVIRRRPRP